MVGPNSEAETPVAEEIERRNSTPVKGKGPDRRKVRVDRRTGLQRRTKTAAEAGYTGPERRVEERREDTGLERRRGPGRRLSDERKTAEEGEMNELQFEFVMAVELYKKLNKRLYPTFTELLEVMRQLGYRKVLPRELNIPNVPEPGLYKPE